MELRNILNDLQNWQGAKENSRSIVVIATDSNTGNETAETAVAFSGKRDELIPSITLAFLQDKKLKELFQTALSYEKFVKAMENTNKNNKKKGTE
ncbi:MAG: hypothetical protein IJ756_05885 [Paludibacteraceae bacterium]|nr:hypothetical protein [Paludibacteraceae bacterium]